MVYTKNQIGLRGSSISYGKLFEPLSKGINDIAFLMNLVRVLFGLPEFDLQKINLRNVSL
jgi:hypothetical protein